MPISKGYFSAAHDREVIEAGGFFCQGCLVGKPAVEQSPDPRYCQSCYVFFTLEANALPAKARKPDWIPEIADKNTAGIVGDTTQIMSTLKAKNIKVDIITARAAARPLPKRGPKHRALPVEKINQWAGEGMGSKAIAARLKGEGVEVSYKTIQRILKGERLLV